MIGAYAIGSHAISGLLPGGILPEAQPAPALVIINGVQVATWENVTIEDVLAGRSTCGVKIIDFEKSLHYVPGLSVVIKWNDRLIFAGTIDSVEETVTERNDDGDIIFTSIECVDFNQLLDRFYVAADYEEDEAHPGGWTVRQIIKDVLQNQTPLAEEGVTLGEIDNNLKIPSISFNYHRVTSCFGALAERTGLTWNVDFTKRLHFFDRSTFVAPFTVGDAGRIDYRNMISSRDRQQYRNVELLRGGHDLTDNQRETFRGDSAGTAPDDRRRTFNLVYEMGELITIKRDGVIQRVGIRQIDKDGDLTVPTASTWPQWFYAVGEKEISQNSERDDDLNPTLSAEQILEVVYKGRFPMLIEEVDATEIAARQAIEGGTGIYQFSDSDDDIEGREFGKLKAKRLLALYGRIPEELKFQMDTLDLVPGHLMEIELAEFGLAAREYMIDSISITFEGFTLPRVNFTLLDGERLQGWADYFRKLADAGKSKVERSNEVIVKTARVSEQLDVGDVLLDSENDSVTLLEYTDDPYTFAWFGEVVVTVSNPVDVVCAFVFGRSRLGAPHGT